MTGDALLVVIDYAVTPAFSDYGLVACAFRFEPEIKRRVASRWMMNTKVFDNVAFVDRARSEIETITLHPSMESRGSVSNNGSKMQQAQPCYRRRN